MIIEALLGGGTGILGSLVTEVAGFFKRKQEHTFRLGEREFELKMMDKEAEIAQSVAASELEKEVTKNEWKAFTESHRPMDRWSTGDHWMMPWVDVVRGLTRPVLTIATQLLLAVIFFTLATDDLRENIVNSAIYMANTSFFWWFGQRQMQKLTKGNQS